ncbi:MAG: hypothetical protein JSV04_09955, partial [Candidatus Heimdallarchaeota archaeon]
MTKNDMITKLKHMGKWDFGVIIKQEQLINYHEKKIGHYQEISPFNKQDLLYCIAWQEYRWIDKILGFRERLESGEARGLVFPMPKSKVVALREEEIEILRENKEDDIRVAKLLLKMVD